MAVTDKVTLKTYFETGDVPTEAQYIDLIDSFQQAGEAMRQYATLADMVAATGLVDGETVAMSGRASAGDGGGNVFAYKATGRPTADNVFTFDGAGADDYFVAINTSIASSKQAGAAADGTTDDKAAIQLLFDAMPSGGIAIISTGTHAVSDTVFPKQGTTVQFAGWLKLDAAGVAPNKHVLRVNEADVTLLNPQIDGDKDNNTSDGSAGTQSGIAVYGTGTDCRIIGGRIINCIDTGLQGGKDGLWVQDVTFENIGEHCVYIAGSSGSPVARATVRGCKFIEWGRDDSRSDAHAVQAFWANDLTLADNTGDLGSVPISGAPDSFAYNMDHCVQVNVSGGIFDNLNNSAISIANTGATATNCGNVTVNGFQASMASTASATSFIKRWSNTENIVVSNGIFRRYSSTEKQPDIIEGCLFSDVPTELVIGERCRIVNCQFEQIGGTRNVNMTGALADIVGCKFSGSNSTAGIAIQNTAPNDESCSIQDCEIDGTGGSRIYVNGGKDISISGNYLPESTSSQAIWVAGSANGVQSVVGNKIPNATADGIRISSGSFATGYMPYAVWFDSVASMVAEVGMPDGTVVATQDYYSGTQGGGNFYTYRASGRTLVTVDGGFFIAAGGSDDYFEAIHRDVADVKQFGAKGVGNTVDDDITAISAALATRKPIHLPAGTYYISAPLDLDVSGGLESYHITGAGSKETKLVPTNSFSAANGLIQTSGGSGVSNALFGGKIEGLTLECQRPDSTKTLYGLNLTHANHLEIKDLVSTLSVVAGVLVGEGRHVTLTQCDLTSCDNWGVLFAGQSFYVGHKVDACRFEACTIGLYASKGEAISVESCRFTNCDFGVYANDVLGMSIQSCVFEDTGNTTVTITSPAVWALRAAIVLNGLTSPNLSAVPTDADDAASCEAVDISGCVWDPASGATGSFVGCCGVDGLNVGDVSFGPNHSRATMPIIEALGTDDLANNVKASDSEVWESGEASNLGRVKIASLGTSQNNNLGRRGLSDWRFSWASDDFAQVTDLDKFVIAGSAGTWENTGEEYRGHAMYSLKNSTTSSYFRDLEAVDLSLHPWMRGKLCVAEVIYFPWSTGVTKYATGVQLQVSSADGTVSSDDATAFFHGDPNVTGSITSGTNTLTVNSATGIHPGAPITVAQAGAGATTLSTFVESVSGVTITLRDNAESTVAGVKVLVPQVQRESVWFRVDNDAPHVDVQVRQVASGNDAGGGVIICGFVIRELGSSRKEVAQRQDRSKGIHDYGEQATTFDVNFDGYGCDARDITLTGATTLTLSASRPGDYPILLRSNTEGAARAITWPANVLGIPPASVSYEDGIFLKVYFDGTNWHI